MARILIVDDDGLICNLTARKLKTIEGLVIDTASNATEARDLLERSAYDLVLSDDRMPLPRQGRELLEDIGKMYPKTGRFLTSGTLRAEEVENLGLDGFFEKPFPYDDLKAQVQKYFAEKERLK